MWRAVAVMSMVLPLVACGGGDDDTSADGGAAGEDGATAACFAQADVEIGHCVESTNNAPCLDFESDTRVFLPVTPTEVIQPIIGLQGLNMFVFAVRGVGIEPGMAPATPMVDVIVWDGETEVGSYRTMPVFYPDDDDPTLMVAPQLFTVAVLADTLEGESLRVTAEVNDPAGGHFCNETTFIVGELIDGAGLP
jgi:hypothetical protein